MKKLVVNSRRYGVFECLLDDEDYALVMKFGNGNGKWGVSVQRGKPYFEKRFAGKLVRMHRLIMGFPSGKYIDHIDRNTLNNQKSNLRACTNGANLRNRSLNKNNTSGTTGVNWSKGRWQTFIQVDKKYIHLGSYVSLKEAKKVRKYAELKYWDV